MAIKAEVLCPRCQTVREIDKSEIKRLKRGGMCYRCTRLEQRGIDNPSWKGGRTKDAQGYIHVLMPEHPFANKYGYVREARAVMEQQLGRPLLAKEMVHHLNGVTYDNRPENLMLFPSNGDHVSHHRTYTPRDWHGRFMKRVAL